MRAGPAGSALLDRSVYASGDEGWSATSTINMMPIQPTRRFAAGLLLTAGSRLGAQQAAAPAPATTEIKRPPRQELETVQTFVRLAHGDQNLERVSEMIAREPKLVYAAWDWGGGDWETGLGGASHIGSRKMARLLLEKGARIDAYCAAMLGEMDIEVVDYHEHALRRGSDAQAAAYVECRTPDDRRFFGVGIDDDVAAASIKAVLSAFNAI